MELEPSESLINCIQNRINTHPTQFCFKNSHLIFEPNIQKQPAFQESTQILKKHRKNSFKINCSLGCSVQCDCYESKLETDNNSNNSLSNIVTFTDDDEETSELLWDESSICTEQSNRKFTSGISYLLINPLVTEEEKNNSDQDDSLDSMISIFEQISESKSNASYEGKLFIADYCLDCRKSHRFDCSNMRYWRLSLVGLSNLQLNNKSTQDQEFPKISQQFEDKIRGGVQNDEIHTTSNQFPLVGTNSPSETISINSANFSTLHVQDIEKQIQYTSEITQSQLLSFSFFMLEHRVNKTAHQRAKNFLKKYNPTDPYYDHMIQMVEEVYRILLLPDDPFKLYISTLSNAKRSLQYRSSLNKLRLQQNKHPLAEKAFQKLKTLYIQ